MTAREKTAELLAAVNGKCAQVQLLGMEINQLLHESRVQIPKFDFGNILDVQVAARDATQAVLKKAGRR